jgi:3-phenylpropionate/trans-cinnamate dioxygenase ferredoxin reductase subunit
MAGVVVVGGGQAAASVVARLRAKGHAGPITILSEESVPPYQRPPLSKGYLLGEMALERLFLRPAAWYAENDIDLHLNTTVNAIDRADKRVIAEGLAVDYDHLVLCTGAVPRSLPPAMGGLLEGVFEVRTLADVDAVVPAFTAGARVLIVGGGYIGLEAAAVAAKLGLKVTLVEAAERILGRVAAPETADYFRALHLSHGVNIREATGLTQLLGAPHVTGAKLSDGSVIEADFVIVGVGITPATTLAEAAGLAVKNGIVVDSRGRTSDAAIWAAGDCAAFPGPGGPMRLESVGNAIDMGELVADNILGADRVYDVKPWFWSDQFDVKLQIAGWNAGHTRVVVRDDSAGARSHWYYAGDRLIAIDAMNDGRAYMVGKRLIEAGKSPAPDAVGDPETDLKQLLKA